VFAPMFASFRRRHPGVVVELAVHDPNAWRRSCVAASSTSPHWCTDTRDLDYQDVRTDRWWCSCRAITPSPVGRRSEWKNWRGSFHPVREGFALNELILDACRSKRITPKIAARSGQVDFIFELVAAGVGIAFLPRVVAGSDPSLVPARAAR